MPGVKERQGAYRSPGPEPSAVIGPALALLFLAALVANGLCGLPLTRAWVSLDNADALSPIFA